LVGSEMCIRDRNVSCLEGFDTGCEEFDRISKG
ncbi:hypothetical protein, partial [Klebsiella quasipneumoniae]